MRRPRLVPALVTAALALAAAADARAQVPAAARWQTLESEHFRVTFTSGLEPLARHAAAAAERARSALVQYLAKPPAGRVDIILSDNVDVSNGSTTPFPTNRIYLYAKPPVDVLELNYLEDWQALVIAHELAHSFHLDATSRLGTALRSIFGRVPTSWPFFPAIGSPGWSVEGLAVATESGVTPMGRLNGTYHEMVARTAALEDRIDDIDRLSSATPVWPGYQRVYVYGSLFLRHLQQQYGDSVLRRIINATASATIPPPLWFDRIGERATGSAFRTAYNAWRDTATAHYRAVADTLAGAGLTATRTLTPEGGFAWYPRWSRDGRAIAYAANDWRSRTELRVLDAETGSERWSRRQNSPARLAWLPDGSLLTSDLEFTDRDHLYLGLRRVGEHEANAVATAPARLQDVDASADGSSAIAVENGGGSNRLVRLDLRTGALTPLTDFAPGVQWAEPRLSPDGERIAVARWTTGGRYDVVILDPAGRVLEELTRGVGINASPAWSPDGRYVVFSADRSGIANLYACDVRTGRLWQVTNLLTGAFQPDISPDGHTVVFSAYHHDGFHLETLPFDTTAWREPPPARQPQLPASSPPSPWPADSSASAAAPYHAGRSVAPHWWAPVVVEQESGTLWGASTGGADLVGRHAWSAWAALSPRSGRSAGGGWYEYRGFPALPGTRLQPSLQLAGTRDWDRLTSPAQPGAPYVEEREDVWSARTVLLHRRFRSVASVAFGGELVSRRRLLVAGGGRRLLDPDDDLLGVHASTFFNNARRYPFGISPEDGITVQLGARQRWDQSRGTGVSSQGDTLRFDAGERELSAWSAGYLALGRVAFAHAVGGVRGSALWRDGPGASTAGVGGSSGGTLPLGDVLDLGGGRFLPVRGFPAGTRRGTRAWTASAELRLPLALLAFKPRPLPFYLDRLSAAAFLDAGDASCAAGEACPADRLGPTLVGAGAELWLDTSVLGAAFLLRAGAAVPVRGTTSREPRFYLQAGPPF